MANADQKVQEILSSTKASVERLSRADGPFPLAEEAVEHLGTKQKYLCFQRGPNSIAYLTLPELYQDCFSRNYDKDFLVYEAERWTYGQVWEHASALARTLAETYGIQRGDRIGIAGRNTPEWVISFLAVNGFLSCTALAVNSWWVGDELRYGIEDSGIKLLLAEDFVLGRAGFLDDLKVPAVLLRGEMQPQMPKSTAKFKALVETGRSLPAMKARAVAKDDAAMLMYTSGTTSSPKGVVMTHRSITTAMNGIRMLSYKKRAPPQQPAILLGSPLFHATGTHGGLFTALCNGSKLCLMYKWDPSKALQIVQDEKVVSLVGVPTMTYDLVNHPDFGKYDTSSLAAVGGGGAAFAAPMIKRVNSKFKSAKAGTGYGLTETNAISVVMPGNLFPHRPTSCGIPIAHMEVCVLDEFDKKAPRGAVGEICFHGAAVFKEYWNKPDKTAEAFHFDEDGALWFRTGDLGRQDEDGFVYIMDRAKDLIIRGGENISCSEVETAVFEHPAIVEVAAVGMPHEHLGEVVAVAIVTKPGVPQPSEAEVIAVAKSKLAGFKVPSEIYFWPDALPRGATGKIQKREIRDQLKARRGSSKL
mmetsp:Transcript_56287/g.119805  ORF Transcript_56287/g.119805 Transcript_56287/m.119805 type:complete len:587 (-) Transcript_56287:174-1934(-)|eukprot:CAMPEP_0206481652 /NCGR_PEP_ID=MMETSP0324_2-20121206/38291_1 /ASSEMBLY_ACC=CAM_ASM_000836 /TAXON_ID=2866 /ORGANISM="Crypthecodinium cohnii, Strain Seligo" /LENGTH=586 /DNA_ID=CAMNT_0053959219 /DNA_START=37 /DNA_END=1797 /DNA_ORIENTATION=+